MSHYTIGFGLNPHMQHHARRANKARSAAVKRALAFLRGKIGKTGLPRTPAHGPV